MDSLSKIEFNCVRFKSFLRSSILLLAPLGCFKFCPTVEESYGNASRTCRAKTKPLKRHHREIAPKQQRTAPAPQNLLQLSNKTLVDESSLLSSAVNQSSTSKFNSTTSFPSSSLGKKILNSSTTEFEDENLEEKAKPEQKNADAVQALDEESCVDVHVVHFNPKVELKIEPQAALLEPVDIDLTTGSGNEADNSICEEVVDTELAQVSLPMEQQPLLLENDCEESSESELSKPLCQEVVPASLEIIEEASLEETKMWDWTRSLAHYELSASEAEEGLFTWADSLKHYSFVATSTETKLYEWFKDFDNLDQFALTEELTMINWVTDILPYYEVAATWKEVEMQDWMSRLIYPTNPWFDMDCKQINPSCQWTPSGTALNWW